MTICENEPSIGDHFQLQCELNLVASSQLILAPNIFMHHISVVGNNGMKFSTMSFHYIRRIWKQHRTGTGCCSGICLTLASYCSYLDIPSAPISPRCCTHAISSDMHVCFHTHRRDIILCCSFTLMKRLRRHIWSCPECDWSSLCSNRGSDFDSQRACVLGKHKTAISQASGWMWPRQAGATTQAVTKWPAVFAHTLTVQCRLRD